MIKRWTKLREIVRVNYFDWAVFTDVGLMSVFDREHTYSDLNSVNKFSE